MSRPNILLITSDQQHYSALGVDNPKLQTPALDRLAREGTRFTRAYCPNPVCSPSRSSIITGQYPSSHGCWTIGVKLPEDVPTVGAALSNAGYATGLIGKAHFQPTRTAPGSESLESMPKLRDLDFWRNFHGPFYGFDHIELARNHADEYLVGQHYAIWLEEQGLTNWPDYFQKWPPQPGPRRRGAWELPERFHYTHWTGERTIAYLERCAAQEQPFFCWASFHDPHPPYLVPEPWASLYDPDDMEPGVLTPGEHDRNPPHFALTQQPQPDFSAYRGEHPSHGFQSHLHDRTRLQRDMAIYYGMISFMDRAIGRILTALDRLGLAENTLVVFTTDHGHLLGQHGLIAKGAFHYEDLLRLPFLVRYPGQVPAGGTSGALQSLVDLAPTFLHAAGLAIPGAMQGVDQLAVWRGEAERARAHVLVENRHQPTQVHLRTYIDDRYKLTVYRDQPYGELFDLVADPGEINNLWDDPAAAALKARLLHAFVNAEIVREGMRMPRIAGA
ncbi:MAG TPA: sulfatase-like hydrolase/transferase [Limnochordia bacterium]|nr:sulfatase-like hydrolase/transferase [Limnochordia bacterium]